LNYPRGKTKVLGTLSDVERQQMEKTLQSFDRLSPNSGMNVSGLLQNRRDERPPTRRVFERRQALGRKW